MFVTLEEAKGYLRVDSSDEDELILRLMETSDRLILDVTRQTPEELKEYLKEHDIHLYTYDEIGH